MNSSPIEISGATAVVGIDVYNQLVFSSVPTAGAIIYAV